ncbi:MAG: ferric reductase-like transmembrane domain-containing protein [Desulforhopalus sp.]
MQATNSDRGGGGRRRLFFGVLLWAALLLYTAAALLIPFTHETTTMWYKAGVDKTILRAGHMAGILALVLLFVQILLAARGKLLVEIFGMATVMRCHRLNGVIVVLAGCLHAGLVLAPEGFANLPIGWKFWPEMVGGVLLLTLLSMVISSQLREKFGLNYRRWRFFHKPLGYLVPVLAVTHVLFVSDAFAQTVPKAALLISFVMVLALVLLSKRSGRRSP